MKKTAAAVLAASIALSAGITASAWQAGGAPLAVNTSTQTTEYKIEQHSSASILSECIDAIDLGGYVVESELISYAYYFGTPDQLNRYTSYENGNNTTDKLTETNATANRWLSQSINGKSTIIKITAKQNVTIRITSESDASHNYICWSPDSYYEYLVEGTASDQNVYRISLDRRFALVDAAENSYATEITLKEGDAFLFLFGSDFITSKSANRWIHFEVTTEYDESKRADFDAMPAVVALRNEKKQTLTAKCAEITAAAGYNQQSVKAAEATLQDADRRFARTSCLQEVNEVYYSLLASLESAKRLTVREDDLSNAINEACAKLDAAVSAIDKVKYAAVLDQIDELYYAGMEGIYTANTPVRVNYQYSLCLNKIHTLLIACEGGVQ